MKISDLFTLEKSTEGVELPIKFPDGTLTGQSIKVRGMDSPEFQKASAERNKGRVSILSLPAEEQNEALDASTRKLLASTVVSWTFEGKCTPEAVEELFRKAPDVMEQIDNFCAKRGNFFTKPPTT